MTARTIWVYLSMWNDKKKKQAKGSFYCKALFIWTWSPSAPCCYTTALAASASVQVEKSPQIFPTVKYHLGKTRKQSSWISEISLRLWIIILGKREVKADDYFFPSVFHSFCPAAQVLGETFKWMTPNCFPLHFLVGTTRVYRRTRRWSHSTAGLRSQAVIPRWWTPRSGGCPALPCRRPFSRSGAVSLPAAALVT